MNSRLKPVSFVNRHFLRDNGHFQRLNRQLRPDNRQACLHNRHSLLTNSQSIFIRHFQLVYRQFWRNNRQFRPHNRQSHFFRHFLLINRHPPSLQLSVISVINRLSSCFRFHSLWRTIILMKKQNMRTIPVSPRKSVVISASSKTKCMFTCCHSIHINR